QSKVDNIDEQLRVNDLFQCFSHVVFMKRHI
ncbi:MAG: hypothetical protein ACI814_000172, partial [Mariniblastus sp.]